MAERHVLYQYPSCPFCRRVLGFVQEQGIDLETRNTLTDPEARRELVDGGGRGTVPCLRIERDGEVRWLYESLDIIEYLRRYHADQAGAPTSHQQRGSNP